MTQLYSSGIRVLYFLMLLASAFNTKAKKWIAGQRAGLNGFKIPSDRQVVWFHCASLGEFDQGLPVMNAYKKQFPDAFLLVTFFSSSGMDFYNKRQHSVDLACYLPLDTKSKATDFMQRFHPDHVFFVKYEFWYNHLLAAKKSGAAVYGVSSLFRPTHRFFKWYGGFFRKALRLFDHFYVQDERSRKLLVSIGITQVTLSGDTRYDRMLAVKAANQQNEIIAAFKGEENLLILGSSWPVDEALFYPLLDELTATYKIIIAPHDVSENHVGGIVSAAGNSVQRYTTFSDKEARILILDTIGQLTSAYRYADITYIGGGFTGKLHNILEPGAFGIPVIFGPKHERFPEAQLFIDRGVAVSINEQTDLKAVLAGLWEKRAIIQEELETIFNENRGAAAIAVNGLSKSPARQLRF